MYTLTIQTKFKFGDRVRFESAWQGRKGTGTIFGVMLDKYSQISYMIDTTEAGEYTDTLVQGIFENEISSIEP